MICFGKRESTFVLTVICSYRVYIATFIRLVPGDLLVTTCEMAWRTRQYLQMLLPIPTIHEEEQDDDKDVFFS
jgi:hypothetical protein